MTKKQVFWVSLIGALTPFILLGVVESKLESYCLFITNERFDPYGGGFAPGGKEYRGAIVHDKIDWCEPVAFALLSFIPLLLLSLITYRLREQVFRSWLHFAYWWIPLSIFFTFVFASTGSGGFGIPNIFDREFSALIFSVLFFLISLILIAVKSWKLKNAKKEI